MEDTIINIKSFKVLTKTLKYLFISLSIHMSMFHDGFFSIQLQVLKVLCQDKEREWL